MKLAYFVHPHAGGTYSVFRNLRSGLLQRGIDLRWMGVGDTARRAARSPEWALEQNCGSIVGRERQSDFETAQEIISTLHDEGFSGVLVNVLGGRIETNIVRYLPERLLKIMVVHTITPATYAAAASIREHVHATICVSPRIEADLTARYGFNRRWTVTIPNGVELGSLSRAAGRREPGRVRLIFLGRIDDSSKGVLWLPDILRHLPEEIRLTVAGDGPDLPRLRRKFVELGERVTFLGAVPPAQVEGLLSQHSIFLMPSRYEGYPVALIEAMSAGCVPVASHIAGVTSAIVTDGIDGTLFPIGGKRQAAHAIAELAAHPERLASMSRRAMEKAHSTYNVDVMSDAYGTLLRRLVQDRPETAAPLPIERWAMARGLQPSLRTYLPVPVKNFLRLTRERFIA